MVLDFRACFRGEFQVQVLRNESQHLFTLGWILFHGVPLHSRPTSAAGRGGRGAGGTFPHPRRRREPRHSLLREERPPPPPPPPTPTSPLTTDSHTTSHPP